MANSQPVLVLLETDVLARYALADYLRECGYKVIEAANTDEALVVLGDTLLNIDVALIDVNASGEADAFAVAQWIRTNKKDADVVLVGSTDGAVDRAGDICAKGPSLRKPYDKSQVLDLIKRLRAARTRVSV